MCLTAYILIILTNVISMSNYALHLTAFYDGDDIFEIKRQLFSLVIAKFNSYISSQACSEIVTKCSQNQ